MNVLSPPRARLQIEIVHDLICPWCYLGVRRLLRTLRRRPDLTFELIWRPFLLNPDMPRVGMARPDYVVRKFGGEDRARRLYATIGEVGRHEGLEFRFERIDIDGGGQSTTLPFKLQTMSGIRNGASVNAQARFEDGSDSGQMNLEIHLGPPPQFVAGTYRMNVAGQVREGTVGSESLTYLGGQADTPSVGGTFVFKDNEGRAIYRLKMPPTAMVRSR